jgi:riboflavin synthase
MTIGSLDKNDMFTGIVEKTAAVLGVADGPGFRRLALALNFGDLQAGQSVAVNGCCLTAAEVSTDEVVFEIVSETLDKTNLGTLSVGDMVNIEQAMKIGDRFDGHFVQGHVDGRANLIDIASDSGDWKLTLEAPFPLAKYIVPKGSVTLDGVSLTVAAVRGNVFEVALIPTTLNVTTLGKKTIGWPFNLEADILSKTVISWLERQNNRPEQP